VDIIGKVTDKSNKINTKNRKNSPTVLFRFIMSITKSTIIFKKHKAGL
jgi:hypothetical protein